MSLVLALLVLGGGSIAVWSGLTDPQGGTWAGLRNVLTGTPNVGHHSPSAVADLLALAGAMPGTAPAVAVAGGGRPAIIATAQSWLGVPYSYGGESRQGVDCSGLVQLVYGANGIKLPRVTETQQLHGVAVSAHAAQPADLVFFGFPASHVGIYLGSGELLHAPHTGAVVRTESVASVAASLPGSPVSYRDVMGATKAPATVPHSGQVRTP